MQTYASMPGVALQPSTEQVEADLQVPWETMGSQAGKVGLGRCAIASTTGQCSRQGDNIQEIASSLTTRVAEHVACHTMSETAVRREVGFRPHSTYRKTAPLLRGTTSGLHGCERKVSRERRSRAARNAILREPNEVVIKPTTSGSLYGSLTTAFSSRLCTTMICAQSLHRPSPRPAAGSSTSLSQTQKSDHFQVQAGPLNTSASASLKHAEIPNERILSLGLDFTQSTRTSNTLHARGSGKPHMEMAHCDSKADPYSVVPGPSDSPAFDILAGYSLGLSQAESTHISGQQGTATTVPSQNLIYNPQASHVSSVCRNTPEEPASLMNTSWPFNTSGTMHINPGKVGQTNLKGGETRAHFAREPVSSFHRGLLSAKDSVPMHIRTCTSYDITEYGQNSTSGPNPDIEPLHSLLDAGSTFEGASASGLIPQFSTEATSINDKVKKSLPSEYAWLQANSVSVFGSSSRYEGQEIDWQRPEISQEELSQGSGGSGFLLNDCSSWLQADLEFFINQHRSPFRPPRDFYSMSYSRSVDTLDPPLSNTCSSSMKPGFLHCGSRTNSELYLPTWGRNQNELNMCETPNLRPHREEREVYEHAGSFPKENYSLLNNSSAIGAPAARQKRHVGVVEFSQESINDLGLATPSSVCPQKWPPF